ncbi:MAG: GNAT family N-acetyltransferase [Pseudomonadota bacterium]
MTHPLDRPVWSALTGERQAHLALGDARAMRFDPAYALFAAARDDAPESVEDLARLIPEGGAVGLVEADDVALPPGAPARHAACVQMTAHTLTAGGPDLAFEALGDGDAAEMLALATLTEPGPFFEKTHRLGDFIGVKQGGRLVAMAGERMKPDGFTEVSGVCTHPDWRGRGYAAGLMRAVAARILARGETAFLHAYAANAGAIGLYESLGFSVRTSITFTVLGDGGSAGHGHG